ncbi:MAG TPA: hypothetical protein VI731_07525, partial [Bacteroidia bacterium]|nr:hypothetical protein [Bacteroidia bacterium]
MKKWLVAVLLVTAGPIKAQKLMGLKGGINFSNLVNTSGLGIDASQSLLLYHGGITGNFPFGRSWSIQPSLLYIVKGARMTHGDPNS